MVSTPVIHAITWITTRLPTNKGWEAELALYISYLIMGDQRHK